MHILHWNHFLMSPKLIPTELNIKNFQDFRPHEGKYQNSTQIWCLCRKSSFFHITFSLTESSSGLDKKPLFWNLNFWYILTVFVAAMKNFQISHPKFHYGFQNFLWRISWSSMGLNRGNKWHINRFLPMASMLPVLSYNPLSLHQILQNQLLESLASLLSPHCFWIPPNIRKMRIFSSLSAKNPFIFPLDFPKLQELKWKFEKKRKKKRGFLLK